MKNQLVNGLSYKIVPEDPFRLAVELYSLSASTSGAPLQPQPTYPHGYLSVLEFAPLVTANYGQPLRVSNNGGNPVRGLVLKCEFDFGIRTDFGTESTCPFGLVWSLANYRLTSWGSPSQMLLGGINLFHTERGPPRSTGDLIEI